MTETSDECKELNDSNGSRRVPTAKELLERHKLSRLSDSEYRRNLRCSTLKTQPPSTSASDDMKKEKKV